MLSALPWFVMWLLSLFAARMADLATRRAWASTGTIRKTANSIGKHDTFELRDL